MVRAAVGSRIIAHDPLRDYHPERPAGKPRYLPQAELEKLMAFRTVDPGLAQARDLFVVASFTGLAYVDMCNLAPGDLLPDQDGVWWIRTHRQKTGQRCNIPLLDVPLRIIKRYRASAPAGKLLPAPKKSTYPGRLKRLARLCGIGHTLSAHVARHNFATHIAHS